MAGIVYPGFTADEPTLAGRAMVTAVDAAAQRSLLGFDFVPADDSAVVHLAGAETVTGQKTFNQPLRIATPAVVGGSLWLGVVENGVDKFGYRDIDNGDLYIAAKSPLSRSLRIIPSDSVSGDVAFRSNGSAYAFRNYLGNYATLQANTLDNPSAALTLGNATYGVAVPGVLTAGTGTFSGQVFAVKNASEQNVLTIDKSGRITSNGAGFDGGMTVTSSWAPSTSYATTYGYNGIQTSYGHYTIENSWSQVVLKGATGVSLGSNGIQTFIGGALVMSNNQPLQWTYGGNAYTAMFMDVNGDMQVPRTLQFQAEIMADRINNRAGHLVVGPEGSQHLFLRTNGANRLSIYSDGSSTFSGDVSAGRTTLTGPTWPVDWATTPVLKVKLGVGIYKAQTWVDSSDVEFAHVLSNGKFQGKAYELTGNVQVSSGMYLDSGGNQLRLAAWSGLRVEYINGTVVPLVLDHLGNLSVTGTLRPGYPASASSISSSDANILDLNAWHGIRVNFGNGAGTPFSINHLGAATFSGDVTLADGQRVRSASGSLRLGSYAEMVLADTLRISGSYQAIEFGGTGAYCNFKSNVPVDFRTMAGASGTMGIIAGASTFNGTISSPSIGNGTGERFGASSATAQYSVAIGNHCSLSGSEAAVAVGHYAGGSYRSVSLGYYAAAGWQGVAIGGGSSTQTLYGAGGVAVGNSTYAHEGSIALGSNAITTAANQFVVGNSATRWTMPATGQRNSEVGNGSGSWQTGYREEYNASGIRCGFYNATPIARQQINSGSATLAADLLVALNNLGLIQSL